MQQTNVLEREQPLAIDEPEEPSCRHHWRIAAPNGATSMGQCKLCGAEREFSNSSSDSIWENDSSDGGNRWRGRGRGAAAVADVPAATRTAPPISESTLGSLLGVGFRSGSE